MNFAGALPVQASETRKRKQMGGGCRGSPSGNTCQRILADVGIGSPRADYSSDSNSDSNSGHTSEMEKEEDEELERGVFRQKTDANRREPPAAQRMLPGVEVEVQTYNIWRYGYTSLFQPSKDILV